MHPVGFTIEICYDARPYERQMNGLSNKYCFISYIYLHMFKTFYITVLVNLTVTVTFDKCQLQLFTLIIFLLFCFLKLNNFFIYSVLTIDSLNLELLIQK